MVQPCVQQPHPPLWYGTNTLASMEHCAKARVNIVTLLPGEPMRALVAAYRAAYAADGGYPATMPLIGVGRHIVVADTDAEALAIARPAFDRWRANFVHLWEKRGGDNPFVRNFPANWDALVATGAACAGSPATVRAYVQAEAASAGFTYLLAQLAFGNLTVAQVTRSAELFATEVMPAVS